MRDALEFCKMNITNPTLVKKKMIPAITRDNTTRNRKELETLFKIVEYHAHNNEDSTPILRDCIRLMTNWVDECSEWIFGKVDYACSAIVALMKMHYNKVLSFKTKTKMNNIY
jgi:hypothetical protein